MNGHTVDYRVSCIAVICKDCNEEVLFPASHKCQQKIVLPLPPLPALAIENENNNRPLLRQLSTTALSSKLSFNHNNNTESLSLTSRLKRSASSKEISNNHPSHHDDKSYLDHYTNLLFSSSSSSSSSPFKSSWKKKTKPQNELYNQLTNNKDDKLKRQNSKLWGKLLTVTQNISSQDDYGAESDESDWEGETHISRILREYYEDKKQQRIPDWLFQDNNNKIKNINYNSSKIPNLDKEQPPSSPLQRRSTTRRLWEDNNNDDNNNQLTAREKERNRLRQQHYNRQQKRQEGSLSSSLSSSDDNDDNNNKERISIQNKNKLLQRQYTLNHSHPQQQKIDDIMMQQAKFVAISRSRSDRGQRNNNHQRPKRYLDINRRDGLDYF